MHVLIIPSEQYIPVETPTAGIFQRAQAEALYEMDHQVGVIAPKARSLRTLFAGSGSWPTGYFRSSEEDIPVYRYLGWSWGPGRIASITIWHYCWIGRRLYEMFEADFGMPDVIHAHGATYAGTLAIQLKEHTGIPVVLTEHSSAYLTGSIKRRQMAAARRTWAAADARIVVSPTLGKAIETYFPEIDKSWKLLPNVLDRAFEEQKEPAPLPRGANRFDFLTVGALIPIKNQAVLISAFNAAFHDDPSVYLSVVGDGPLRRALETKADQLGIGDRIRFLGQLDRSGVLKSMQECDCFVLPSLRETFGVVLIEALSCGKPVVATACGGPEYVVLPEDGLLADSPTVTALVSKLKEIHGRIHQFDPPSIRARCIRRFGRETFVSSLEQIYRGVTQQRK